MAHPLEAAIGGIDAAAHNGEAFAIDLLAEAVILGEENLFVESAQLPESFSIEKHEHAGRERTVQVRQILKQIVADVEQLVDPASAFAHDVGGQAMQLPLLRFFHATTNERRVGQFNIGIE